jgi:CBS domain-containing protein
MTATKQHRTIGDLMTRAPISVTGATTASQLALLLDENEISGVPVVDGIDRVIGVVSRTNLLHRCVEGPLGSRPGSFLMSIAEGLGGEIDTETLGVVSEFMNPAPVTAGPDEPIDDIARRMRDERVHRVIIVDQRNHLLGIVTSLDMLKLVGTHSASA